ncbi:glycosyltransferase [Gloeocapsopsis sp. IPPAS B-1203]|uniref:glycosyltransferase n=1 Tax=Gloeocapsopsis sp. IPPAS B-1203 TaxID=2049454 RepID=UPI000C17716C|nr:glycosyltransferase [Gloeocapsopsis sp. IPPAS B-1203]PIG95468.1 hypothetical protein CSQ79_03220 [Gloeocapsopsis sp. IPPAS B-1203]
MKKKALIFFPHNPYPPRTGAHQRCLSMLEAFKKLGYDVTLFGSTLLTDNLWQVDSIKNLQKNFDIGVEVYQGTSADKQFMAQTYASRKGEFNWDFYTPPGLCESFRKFFKSLSPDIIVINYAFWARLVIGNEFNSSLKVIEMHDLLSLTTKMQQVISSFLTEPPFISGKVDHKLLDKSLFSKLTLNTDIEEYWLYDQFDFTIAISPQEAQHVQTQTCRTTVKYIPLSYNVELINNTYTNPPLFVIGPNYFNIQGYLYFTDKILPLVLSQAPEFVLQVIGDACSLLVPTDGINLLGFIPSLKQLYAESKFAVCPLIGGTGQQVKIVEAMANGLPVIALQNVAESSPIQHNINGFVATNAAEFANYTIKLFTNQNLCRQMGQAARETVNNEFSKQKLLEKLYFLAPNNIQNQIFKAEKNKLIVIIDGVFFQLYKTGIARVWKSLLEEWVESGFAKHIIVLDRAGTAPVIPSIRYRPVPAYDYNATDVDREMLQQVCDEEGADIFISSYYTTPLSTPSVFLAHDMIPELMGWNLNHPMWREKHYGIQHASAYIAVSENTAKDLVKVFPNIPLDSVTVASNGVNHKIFSPACLEDINQFKNKYGITKPYFMLVGSGGYKNTILFFKAFAQLCSKQGFEIVCTGGGWELETELRNYTSGSVVHMLQLSDEELSIAYSGAVALVYPSKYEGFGLPILEAIACGCPVVTCPNGSIPEVAGDAAIYVNDDDVDELADALCEVQKPSVRNSLVAAGLEQAQKFSWAKMADTVSSALVEATLLPLNLKQINLVIFPDWSQSEDALCTELLQVIQAIATHPDSSRTTLLVDNGEISEEEANLILSSVAMNLLMAEDLDISEGLEISLVGHLSEMQWKVLLPKITARIILENENQAAIAKAETIPSYELDNILLNNCIMST